MYPVMRAIEQEGTHYEIDYQGASIGCSTVRGWCDRTFTVLLARTYPQNTEPLLQ
jgi:hypothetical protein